MELKLPPVDILAISGSRSWTHPPHFFIDKLAKAIAEAGIEVYLGDNPQGVDAWLLDRLTRAGVKPTIWCAGNLRIDPPANCQVVYVQAYDVYTKYYERDAKMVKAAQGVLAVWNGTSKGTRLVYEAGLDQRKPSALCVYIEGFMQLSRKTYP